MVKKLWFLIIYLSYANSFAQQDDCTCLEMKNIYLEEYDVTFNVESCLDTINARNKYEKIKVIAFDCGTFLEVEYFYKDGSLKSRSDFIVDSFLNVDTVNFLDPDNPYKILSTEIFKYVRGIKHGIATFYNLKGDLIRKEVYSNGKEIFVFLAIKEEVKELDFTRE
jgi:hypothetical protein